MRYAIVGASLVILSLTSVTRAGTIYEGFAYPQGQALPGQNGGSGWANAWSGFDLQVSITPGLSFGGLATSPGAASSEPRVGQDVAFYFRDAASTFGADNTTVFLSFLLRPDDGFGFYGGLNLQGLFVGKSGITNTYGIEAPTDDVSSSSIVANAGTTVFLVLRADFLPGNDEFRLYVNPVPGGPEPTTPDATKTNFDVGTVSSIYLNNAGSWTTDEIRIGDSFAAVTATSAVPEPTTLVQTLAAFSVLGLWLTHQRRQRGRSAR